MIRRKQRVDPGEKSKLRGKIVYVGCATESDVEDVADGLTGQARCMPDLKRSKTVVARENGRLIGFGVLEPAADGPGDVGCLTVDVGCLTVMEQRGDRGVRRTLLSHLLERTDGIRTVYTDIENDREMAGMGFRRDRVETAAVMTAGKNVCCAGMASAALVRYRRF